MLNGGRLILNFFDPRLDYIASGIAAPARIVKEREFTDPATGHRVVFSSTSKYSPETQRIDVEFLFEEMDNGSVIGTSRSSFALRWMYRYEMEHLLALCGFEVEALFGDLHRGPFRYGGEQVWEARKA